MDSPRSRASPAVIRLSTEPSRLGIAWSDGTEREFASVWLRDNIPSDRDTHSGQRLVDVMDIPGEPRISAAAVNGESLDVSWEGEARGGQFPLAWLYRYTAQAEDRPELRLRLWLEGASLDRGRDFAGIGYAELAGKERSRLEWLTRLLQDGIGFVSGLPQREHAILEATALLGYVPETNYGRVFDVRAVPQPENLAYTDLGLGLHTDNPYREPVPGFQALHTLVASPDGGDSLFADGFALAAHLRSSAPEDFEKLSHTPVPFLYQAAGAELYAERPLIELSCTDEIVAVNYNNRSIRPLRLPARDCEAFYAAYRRFASLLREPRFQLATRLEDGELVVFDNRRVLHGRTGFTSARHPRHLQGCYLTRDSVHSKTAVLRRQLDGDARP
jgi:alpha-ketoglutarate-dependent taurine dioxygenase